MDNSSNNDITDAHGKSCATGSFSLATKFAKALPYALIFLISFAGNVMILVAMNRNKQMRRTVNYFIANMAFSDLLSTVVFIPTALAEIVDGSDRWLPDGLIGEISCKLITFLSNVSTAVSIASLVCISADRFFAVVCPMRAHIFTGKVRAILICMTWIAVASLYATDFYTSKLQIHNNTVICDYSWEPAFNHAKTEKLYSPLMYIGVTIVPFVVITVLYAVIGITLARQTVTNNQPSTERLRRSQENKKVLVLSATIVIAFALCWAPLNLFMFMATFNRKTVRSDCNFKTFLFASLVIATSSYAVNPCICFFFLSSYRRTLMTVFKKGCCVKRQNRNKTGFNKSKYC